MGLMTEWDVLLLDEVSLPSSHDMSAGYGMLMEQVTVDLDVLVRSDLIDFLVSESETRGATIVCKSTSTLLEYINSIPSLPYLMTIAV